jgi:hypothetical protein
MTKFKIRGSDVCYDAATWCAENINDNDWTMWLSENNWTIYTFEINRPEDATLFALKWANCA